MPEPQQGRAEAETSVWREAVAGRATALKNEEVRAALGRRDR
ncbi:hypothetical protein [Streptomyces sp. AM8-1-1]|nr:hypothetical protein [Streptomyces sp. AM8-1-1]WNO70121.1 hypothetical protein RPQ07_00030 [Streptomyces sp. AM8-1-1]WNO76994.1 hypothetical protein RPQ07_37695 [Streptomyces sp. AM8-1-1]